MTAVEEALMTRAVRYYPPFTHYVNADLFRFSEMVLAFLVALSVLLLAVRRWREHRRSASAFLCALTLSMFVEAGSSIVALGHPPIWWLIAGRYAVLIVTSYACVVVIGEARRGIWARQSD